MAWKDEPDTIDEVVRDLLVLTTQILVQVKETNGRVTALEMFRSSILGGLILAGAVLSSIKLNLLG